MATHARAWTETATTTTTTTTTGTETRVCDSEWDFQRWPGGDKRQASQRMRAGYCDYATRRLPTDNPDKRRCNVARLQLQLQLKLQLCRLCNFDLKHAIWGRKATKGERESARETDICRDVLTISCGARVNRRRERKSEMVSTEWQNGRDATRESRFQIRDFELSV